MLSFGTKAILTGALAFALASVPAGATIIFDESPMGTGDNILFGSQQSGTTLTGTLNSNSDVVAEFTTDGTGTIKTQGVGQSSVEFETPSLQSLLSFMFTNLTPGVVVINPDLGSGQTMGDATEALVTATATDGGTFTHNLPLGMGQNFLTITAADGESISGVSIDTSATGTFAGLSQVRVGPPFTTPGGGPPQAIPEPATYGMLGLALLGFATMRKRFAR